MKKLFLSIFLLTASLINLPAQENDSLEVNYFTINSFPQNVSVYLGDELAGNTPFRIHISMLKIPSMFTLKAKGFYDEVIRLSDSSDLQKKNIFITLKPLRIISNQLQVFEGKSIFFSKKRQLVPVVISSLLTAGGAVFSYYFKRLANDNYDVFRQNGDQSALDKTKRYDIYSAVSLAVFQVGFAGLIYFLLMK